MTPITSLRKLRDALKAIDGATRYAMQPGIVERTLCAEYGLPVAHGRCDWSRLPTFGGGQPSTELEVWSWDETSLLVGTCADDIEIVRRPGVWLAGDRVSAGEGADFDTGSVVHIDGDMAVVSWDSGVRTPCPLGDLTMLPQP